jgi:hypothetical protein
MAPAMVGDGMHTAMDMVGLRQVGLRCSGKYRQRNNRQCQQAGKPDKKYPDRANAFDYE